MGLGTEAEEKVEEEEDSPHRGQLRPCWPDRGLWAPRWSCLCHPK